jgi:RHS repeat-associated protein
VGTDGVNRVQVYSQGGQLLYANVTGSALANGTKYVYLHNHVIAEVNGTAVQYHHTDGLGSPVARTDAAARLISRTRYEPYGATAAGAESVIGFAGHVTAADLGLVYMQQRYYDPVAGRFLSIDPVTTDANTGGSFNRFVYANNNPYRFIDPDGRSSCADKECKTSTIDSTITRADGEPTKINFVNDNPKGASPNQPVATKTAILIEQIISGQTLIL